MIRLTKKNAQTVLLIFFPVFLLYILNWFLDVFFYIYQFIPTFDVIMHFLGGLLCARAMYLSFLEYKDEFGIRFTPYSLILFYLVASVALIAYIWEVYEQLHDILLHTVYQGGTQDLLLDMFLGMLGAFTYWLAVVPKKEYSSVAVKKTVKGKEKIVRKKGVPAKKRVTQKGVKKITKAKKITKVKKKV